jgi:AcrR family transcriptional regulator
MDDPGDPSPPATRRRRDASRTRRDILVAAGQHFARRGYSHVKLQEIADDVGVTPAMIVRYFGTKLALFEEVVSGGELDLPLLVEGDREAQMIARARAVLEFFQDRTASAGGLALLRSLDLDDGELFRSEIDRRILRPWSKEITGPDAELRVRLVAGVLLGVGMFSLGALVDPDRPPLGSEDAERMVHHLAALLSVCIDP